MPTSDCRFSNTYCRFSYTYCRFSYIIDLPETEYLAGYTYIDLRQMRTRTHQGPAAYDARRQLSSDTVSQMQLVGIRLSDRQAENFGK